MTFDSKSPLGVCTVTYMTDKSSVERQMDIFTVLLSPSRAGGGQWWTGILCCYCRWWNRAVVLQHWHLLSFTENTLNTLFTFNHPMWKLGLLSNSFLIPSPDLLWRALQYKFDLWPKPCWDPLFFGLCKKEMVSRTPSHPHTDLWAAVVSRSFFGFLVVGELPPDEHTVYTLLTQGHSPHRVYASHPVPDQDPTLQTIVLSTQTLLWPMPEFTSAFTDFIKVWFHNASDEAHFIPLYCERVFVWSPLWAPFTYPAWSSSRWLFIS